MTEHIGIPDFDQIIDGWNDRGERFGAVGKDKLSLVHAALSEGRCPSCGARTGPRPDDDWDDRPETSLSGWCSSCRAYWTAGTSENGEWVSLGIRRNSLGGCLQTLTFNPPPDDDPDDWYPDDLEWT